MGCLIGHGKLGHGHCKMTSIVSCSLLPHGALLLDPQQQRECHPDARHEMVAEVAAFVPKMEMCCDGIAAAHPDLIVLLTPHGHQCESQFLVYAAENATGSAKWDDCWSEFRLTCSLDVALSKSLCGHLKASHVPCDSFVSFSPNCHIPLRWGEVVPLHFVQQAFQKQTRKLPPLIIISLPSRRLVFDEAYEEMLHKFTSSLLAFFNGQSRRTAFVVSGDLSHRHPSPRTHPAPPFPTLDDGQPEAFDALVEAWVRTAGTAAGTELVTQAIALKHLFACGLSGLVVLDGILCQHAAFRVHAEAVARIHPTYYGMITAHWGSASVA